MHFLEKIQPHLISDDLLIQESILHAINEYPALPGDWVVKLLKEAFSNVEKQSSILIHIDNQPITEDALKILLEYIPNMDQKKVHLALKLFNNVEPALAMKYRGALKGYIPKDNWSLFELLLNGEEEEVYEKYGEVLNDIERASMFPYQLLNQARHISKTIVEKGWIAEEEIEIVLKEELENQWFSINGILNVYMLGLLKIEKYIPLLASLLERDEDFLLEEVATALIGFQSDKVVEAVEPFINKSESVIYAVSIIGNIKTDRAVEVLRRAYSELDNLEDQDTVIEALCHQFSEKGLPEISEHMSKKYFSNLIDMEHTAYSYYSILDLKHPALDKWRKAALQRELDFQNSLNKNRSTNFHEPIRNEIKVGRNDPCLCGSGKKYKKCCGK
ncbi:MAG TPA: HEAT repeat domain-containing protein [Niallia sp.]|nr:HEAT repeat domain-containing protein [Niallia sp.]